MAGPDWEGLQAALAGEVVLPGTPGYEQARRSAITAVERVRPLAVVRCSAPGDVAETLAFARRLGVHVAPRSGGHCFAGRSSTEGIVLDVRPMHAVSVAGGVATIGAGARLGEVYDALAEQGLTIPAGCGATVGIAGLTLGGGLGLLGRRHGLTCDHLRAAQVVLADGRVVQCDERRHPGLFWALRGAGGGQFGVVTSLVLGTVAAPAVTTFSLTWRHADAAALIGSWQEWAPFAPDELDAALRLSVPAEPEHPPIVSLVGTMLALEADTAEAVGAFAAQARAEPASVAYAHLPYREAKRSLGGPDVPDDGEPPPVGKSELFRRSLPPDAIAALVGGLSRRRRAGVSREVGFTPLGGAYNRVPAGATAFAHRNERFLVEHVAVAGPRPRTADAAAARAWLARSWASIHPWGSGRVYPNFPDPDLEDWAEAYHGSNLERLTRVKRAYDPDDVFRFPQSLRSSRS